MLTLSEGCLCEFAEVEDDVQAESSSFRSSALDETVAVATHRSTPRQAEGPPNSEQSTISLSKSMISQA